MHLPRSPRQLTNGVVPAVLRRRVCNRRPATSLKHLAVEPALLHVLRANCIYAPLLLEQVADLCQCSSLFRHRVLAYMQEPGHPAPTSGGSFRSAALAAVAAAASSQGLGCTEGEPPDYGHCRCIVALALQVGVPACARIYQETGRSAEEARQLPYLRCRVQVEQPGSAVSGGSGEGTPAPSSLWHRGSQWLWASMSLDLTSRPCSTRVAATARARCRKWRRTPPPSCILGSFIPGIPGNPCFVAACFAAAGSLLSRAATVSIACCLHVAHPGQERFQVLIIKCCVYLH